MGVCPEGAKGLFRAVARRGEPVGSEPYPREKRGQRKLVKNVGVERIAALAEKKPLCEFPERHDPIEYIEPAGKPFGRYNQAG